MLPVALAEGISIIFAFIVNKYLVFNNDKQAKSSTAQFIIFIIGRAIAASIDFLLTYLMIDRFARASIHWLMLRQIDSLGIFHLGFLQKMLGTPVLLNKISWVFAIQVIIIVLNYIVSKYFAFK